QELCRPAQDLLEVAHGLLEVVGDGAALRVAELPAGRQRVHEVPVAEVGRDAAGARVWVREVSHLLERGEVVADRGGRDAEPVAFGDGLAPDGFPGPDELLDHGAEHRRLPGPELAPLLLCHGWSFSTR